jgi:hypothetical protein
MKYLAIVAIACFSPDALATVGPTSIGNFKIGMSKVEYISAAGIVPVDCNKSKGVDPQVFRAKMENLNVNRNALCFDFRSSKTGIIENIQVAGVSYDVVQADYKSSSLINSLGNSVKAIFLNDRLISITVTFPNVDLETLSVKYGQPLISDKTKIEICKNRIGNEFKNRVGHTDATWVNGGITATYRIEQNAPRDTCSDGLEMNYYLLEDANQMKLINSAIINFRNASAKSAAKDSVF